MNLLPLLLLNAMPATNLPSVTITSEMICKVQFAIKHKREAWPPALCDRVAVAYNETFKPIYMLAISINESDLHYTAFARAQKRTIDGGLTGVRCHLDNRKRCKNWPVKGWTLKDLQDPVQNIHAGAKVLERKLARHGAKAWLYRYNGSPHENGYTARIHAIIAALGGIEVKTKNVRIRKLIEKIIAAVKL